MYICILVYIPIHTTCECVVSFSLHVHVYRYIHMYINVFIYLCVWCSFAFDVFSVVLPLVCCLLVRELVHCLVSRGWGLCTRPSKGSGKTCKAPAPEGEFRRFGVVGCRVYT